MAPFPMPTHKKSYLWQLVCSSETACLDFGGLWACGGGACIMRLPPTTFLFVILLMHSLNAVSHLEITARRGKLIHRFNWG